VGFEQAEDVASVLALKPPGFSKAFTEFDGLDDEQ
jgi:hypothetical protein